MKTALAVSLAAALLALAACGSRTGGTVDDPGTPSGTSADPGTMPTSVPPPEGEVVGVGTVMDTGDETGPELCLGAVAESYPPQCSGVPLVDWDWATVGRTYERSGDVRWGSYAVQGRYDGTTMTVTQDPVTSALYDAPAPAEDPFVTACPEPEGGWRIVDPDKVEFEDQDAVLVTAMQLPGYAGSFVDGASFAGLEQPDADRPVDDASRIIVNVLVTEDVEGAEQALREVWGGALCVTRAEHTEQELLEIQDRLTDLPGLLSSGTQLDRVVADVLWDDGTLQAWADATYGEGLVRITSALREVPSE
jgi:hypothetical protein